MRLLAAIQGNLNDLLKAELAAAERAVTAGVRAATDGLKTELRRQIIGAGLGNRLANTWRGEVYPKGQPSIGAAGFVWSKAPGMCACTPKARSSARSRDCSSPSRRRPSASTATPGRRSRQDPGSASTVSPGQPEPAGRRQRPADEARRGCSQPGQPPRRSVHPALGSHHLAAVHPRPAGDGAQAPRCGQRDTKMGRGVAAAGAASVATMKSAKRSA